MDKSETSTDIQDLLSEIGNLREELAKYTSTTRVDKEPRVLLGTWAWAIIVLLWIGVLAILIEMAALLFNFWRLA